MIGVRSGAITSAADLVEITLHGPGGHTARPEQTVDLVTVAARVVSELPELLREQVGDLNLVFGAIDAGDAANVIPTTARLRGTVRSRDRDAWAQAPDALVAALDEVAGPTGATVELVHDRGVPPVVNDATMTEVFATGAHSVVGDDAVVAIEQSAGADDFPW